MQHFLKAPHFSPRRRALGPAIAGLVYLHAAGVWASNWPTRTVRIVVGYPPGSSPDMLARVLAVPLARVLGQSVVVENRAGANGVIGAQAVVVGDDHVFGIMPNAPLVTASLLNPKLSYAAGRDLLPISLLATTPFVLVAAANQPSDPKAFIAAARVAGDKWSYGSTGAGSAAHLGMEAIQRNAGWRAVHVPYQGNPGVVTALATGEIQMALLPPGLVTPQINSGRLHVIGLTGGRSVLMPSAPSLRDYNLKGVEVEGFVAAVSGRSMTQAQRMRLGRALSDIVQDATTRQKLFDIGWKAVGSAPDTLNSRIAQDTVSYGALIGTLGIAEK
jgi:tripartite-type tricarboxylate transporter receptor subunit TctC